MYSGTNVWSDFQTKNVQHHQPRTPRAYPRPHPTMNVMRNMHVAGVLPDGFFAHDKKIHMKFGRFYVIFPRRVEAGSLLNPRQQATLDRCRQEGRSSCAALDPGVRKMLAVYTPDGYAEVIGTNATKVLDRHIRRITRQGGSSEWNLFIFKHDCRTHVFRLVVFGSIM